MHRLDAEEYLLEYYHTLQMLAAAEGKAAKTFLATIIPSTIALQRFTNALAAVFPDLQSVDFTVVERDKPLERETVYKTPHVYAFTATRQSGRSTIGSDFGFSCVGTEIDPSHIDRFQMRQTRFADTLGHGALHAEEDESDEEGDSADDATDEEDEIDW